MNLKDLRLLKRFLRYLRPYAAWIRIALCAMPVGIAAAVLSPWLIMKVVDFCLKENRPAALPWWILAMLAAALTGYAADSIYSMFLQRAGQQAIYSMRRDLFLHTMRLPRRFFDRNPAGATLTRLTTDFEALGDTMAVGILSLVTDFIKILAVLVFLCFISPVLTGLLVLICAPSVFLTRWLQRKMRDLYNRSWSALSSSTGFLQECLKGAATIQLYNAEERAAGRYREKNGLFFHAQRNANISEAALSTMVEGLISLATATILLAGGRGIAGGTLTIGAVVAFINAAPRIFVPIRDFTFQLATMQRAFAALEHIEELFAQEPEKESARGDLDEKLFSRFESLEFDRVSFRYSSDRPYVLKDVSFRVKQGDRIALVGPTGSGKSTIIKLIMRSYEPYEGSIRMNGVELRDIPRRMILRLITLMPQDPHLFKETVSFNIGLQRRGLTPEMIMSAASYVRADTFVQSLPDGYESAVSEHGSNFSAGQAQLLCFARSIAGGTNVIILDEATSSVDSVTEHLIEQAIAKVFEEKTVIAIAHRLSTIRGADQILVLEDGGILERGNHAELLARGGLYARLVKSMTEGHITHITEFD